MPSAWGSSMLIVSVLDCRRVYHPNGIPGRYEHVGAYCVATLLWVLAYPQLSSAGVGAVLAACAGLLQLGPTLCPRGTLSSATLPRAALA